MDTDTKARQLMRVMDQINARMARHAKTCIRGVQTTREEEVGNKNPNHTMRWDEMIWVVK